jgi:hypothetical protein
MEDEIKVFNFDEKYSQNVHVYKDGSTFIGELEIGKESTRLTIRGESSGNRDFKFDGWELDQIQCDSLRESFLLRRLSLCNSLHSSIGELGKPITSFQITFEVKEVFLSRGGYGSKFPAQVRAIELKAKQIGAWIGHTDKQREIISCFDNAKQRLNAALTHELVVDIEQIGKLGVVYKVKQGFSLTEFRSGMTFEPSIFFTFSTSQSLVETSSYIRKLITVFSFLFGKDFKMDSIHLYFQSSGYSNEGSYITTEFAHNHIHNGFSLFPFEEFDSTLNEPSWHSIFIKFFSATRDEMNVFEKYLKYRKLENVEERFLGFFRLLEKLTHKKASFLDSEKLNTLSIRFTSFLVRYFDDKKNVVAFLKRLQRINDSKYNTEKCISDFLINIPESIRNELLFTKNDLSEICKLRNDIIHANEYSIASGRLFAIASFIELLLIIKLAEFLTIPLSHSENYVFRYENYFNIKKLPGIGL